MLRVRLASLCAQVCCVTYRADLMATTLFLGALLAYVICETASCAPAVARRQYAAFVGLAVASTLCKEQGVTVFGVVLVHDALRCLYQIRPRATSSGTDDVISWPVVWRFGERLALTGVVVVTVMAVRLRINHGPAPKWAPYDNILIGMPPGLSRTLTFVYLVSAHMAWQLWPVTLCHDWNHESVAVVTDLTDPRNAVSAVVVLWLGLCVLLAAVQFLGAALQRQRHRSDAGRACVVRPVVLDVRPVEVGGLAFSSSALDGSDAIHDVDASCVVGHSSSVGPAVPGQSCEGEGDPALTPSAVLGNAVATGGAVDVVSVEREALLSPAGSLLMAVAIMLVSFLPASNLFFEVGFTLAERVMYLPSVGGCFMAGLAYDWCHRRLAGRRTPSISAVGVPAERSSDVPRDATETSAGCAGHTSAGTDNGVAASLDRDAAQAFISPRSASRDRSCRRTALPVVLGLVLVACFTKPLVRSLDWVNFDTLLTADVISNPSNPKNWYSLGACRTTNSLECVGLVETEPRCYGLEE